MLVHGPLHSARSRTLKEPGTEGTSLAGSLGAGVAETLTRFSKLQRAA